MKTILPEFIGSMERIKNNFYFSFLAVVFLNCRPFQKDVTLPVKSSQNRMSAQSLNNFDEDGVQEYGNSIRRHFLNDICIAYERYSILMFASHRNNKTRIDPCSMDDKSLGAKYFEDLNVYREDDVKFLVQLRRLRNSIVHYNGVYNKSNKLDYRFGTQTYNSIQHECEKISIQFDNILWVYDKLLAVVKDGNAAYFTMHT